MIVINTYLSYGDLGGIYIRRVANLDFRNPATIVSLQLSAPADHEL